MALVLIVEDDGQARVLAEGILQENGFLTLSASTVEQAIALLDDPEKIEALFVDLILHDNPYGGLWVAQEAVKRLPRLPVLYTTSQGITDQMQDLFVENFAFLGKPYTAEKLVGALNDLLSLHRGASTRSPSQSATR